MEVVDDKYLNADDQLEEGYYHLDDSAAAEYLAAAFEHNAEVDEQAQVLGYYLREYRERQLVQPYLSLLHWLIDNNPEHPVLRCNLLLTAVGSKEYRSSILHWDDAVRKQPNNSVVLDHAAFFCRPRSRMRAAKYWTMARGLEPRNVRWCMNLASLYRGMCGSPSNPGALASRRGWPGTAVSFAIEAIQLNYDTAEGEHLDSDFLFFVKSFGEFSVEFGLFEETQVFFDCLKRDNRESSSDYALSIKGRCFLRQGDLEAAVQCIEQMASVHSPNMLGLLYEPDLSLAKELIAEKASEPVLRYLTRCLKTLNENLNLAMADPPKFQETLQNRSEWELKARTDNLRNTIAVVDNALKNLSED